MDTQTNTGTPTSKALAPIQVLRNDIVKMSSEFKAALPAHLPTERFTRVLLTALQSNPDLVKCTQHSLMGACMKAAQDGLVIDGREAALTTFNCKVKQGDKEVWEKRAQYLPMVAGIMKKMRNSGEISTVAAHVAYAKDKFTYVLGDDERIVHEPYVAGDPGIAIAVYAIVKLKDGGIQREVMPVAAVEAIRKRSKSPDKGPWATDWSEMARKTVLRRISKYLPASTDKETGESVIDITRRDDDFYDLDTDAPAEAGSPVAEQTGTAARPPRKARGAAAKALDEANAGGTVIDGESRVVDGDGRQHQEQQSEDGDPRPEPPQGDMI
jgi:recombination protein RecT